MPTFVKIGDTTEKDEKCAAEALTAVDNDKRPHQDGQVSHIHLPSDGKAYGEEQLGQKAVAA